MPSQCFEMVECLPNASKCLIPLPNALTHSLYHPVMAFPVISSFHLLLVVSGPLVPTLRDLFLHCSTDHFCLHAIYTLSCPQQLPVGEIVEETVVFEAVAETKIEAETPTLLCLFPPVVSAVTDVVLPFVMDANEFLVSDDIMACEFCSVTHPIDLHNSSGLSPIALHLHGLFPLFTSGCQSSPFGNGPSPPPYLPLPTPTLPPPLATLQGHFDMVSFLPSENGPPSCPFACQLFCDPCLCDSPFCHTCSAHEEHMPTEPIMPIGLLLVACAHDTCINQP